VKPFGLSYLAREIEMPIGGGKGGEGGGRGKRKES